MIKANLKTVPVVKNQYNIEGLVSALASRCEDKEQAKAIIHMSLAELGFDANTGVFKDPSEDFLGVETFGEIISGAFDNLPDNTPDGKFRGFELDEIFSVAEIVNDVINGLI